MTRSLLLAAGLTCCLLTPAWAALGVGFGLIGQEALPHATALGLLREQRCRLLRTWSVDVPWLKAVDLAYSNEPVEVTVSIPNTDLRAAATDDAFLQSVVATVMAFSRIIRVIAIGNEPDAPWNSEHLPFVVPALTRLYQALKQAGLDKRVTVTVPFSAGVLVDTYPIPASKINPALASTVNGILPTLLASGSVFSINLYPYLTVKYGQPQLLDMALGRHGASLLTAMIQGCQVALRKAGYPGVPVLVSETGWPSEGSAFASLPFAKEYSAHVAKVAANASLAQSIFLFEAFDEAGKSGAPDEPFYGMWSRTGAPKYPFPFSS